MRLQQTLINMFLAVLCVVTGCRSSHNSASGPVTLHEDDVSTKQEVLRHIPIGSSVDDAQALMEKSGCTCAKYSDEDGRYLYCYHEKSVKLTYGRIWKIFFYYNNDGVITKVSVTTGLVGL